MWLAVRLKRERLPAPAGGYSSLEKLSRDAGFPLAPANGCIRLKSFNPCEKLEGRGRRGHFRVSFYSRLPGAATNLTGLRHTRMTGVRIVRVDAVVALGNMTDFDTGSLQSYFSGGTEGSAVHVQPVIHAARDLIDAHRALEPAAAHDGQR